MTKVEQLKQEIKELEDQIELKRLKLEHEEEKEALCAEKDAAFKSVILAQLRAGEIGELAALTMCEELGIDAEKEIEKAAGQKETHVAAI